MLELSKVYDVTRTTTKKKIALVSGRNAGKSVNISILSVTKSLCTNEDYDTAICRSTSSAINTGIKIEIKKVINNLDDWYKQRVNIPKINHEITFTHNDNKIKFMGVGEDKGSSDRTRGYTTEKPLRYIIMEEAQQMTKESFHDALFTLRRNLAPNGQEIYLLNPEPNPEHWLNIEVAKWRDDPDYLVIDSSYLDILKYISEEEFKDIQKIKENDPEFYEWKYMGKVTGLYAKLAIPHFNDHVYQISELPNEQPLALIIGVDNATLRDKTGFVPILLMPNDVRYTLEPFYYDPRAFRPMSNSEFAEFSIDYLDALFKRYNLGKYYTEPAAFNRRAMPIVFSIDSAVIGADLALTLNVALGQSKYATVAWAQRFTKKAIHANNADVNTLFRNNKIFILDMDTYFTATPEGFKLVEDKNVLLKQIRSVIWNDRRTGYDPAIPNDVLDAFIYGICATILDIEDILKRRII